MQQEIVVSETETGVLARHIALRIELARTGVRQYDVADKLGMSEGQLSKILAGRKPLSDELDGQIREAIASLTVAL